MRIINYGSVFLILCSAASNQAYSSNLIHDDQKKMTRFFVNTEYVDGKESTVYYQLRDIGTPIVLSQTLDFRAKKKSPGIQRRTVPKYGFTDDGAWGNFNSLISFSSTDLGVVDSPFDPID